MTGVKPVKYRLRAYTMSSLRPFKIDGSNCYFILSENWNFEVSFAHSGIILSESTKFLKAQIHLNEHQTRYIPLRLLVAAQ